MVGSDIKSAHSTARPVGFCILGNPHNSFAVASWRLGVHEVNDFAILYSMTSKVGLFEYLAVPVADFSSTASTRITEADETYDDTDLAIQGFPDNDDPGSTRQTREDRETFDDDQGIGPFGCPADLSTGTSITLTPETFDDDPAIDGLALPVMAQISTLRGADDYETYADDPGLEVSGIPRSVFDQTRITKADTETSDDDLGVQGLNIPS